MKRRSILLPVCLVLASLVCATLPCFIPANTAAAPQKRVPQDLEVYTKCKHLVDFSLEELLQSHPDLAAVEFDSNQTELPFLLENVGRNVEAFLRDFPNTSSRESVRHERLKNWNDVQSRAEREYQYLLLGSGPIGIREARNDARGKPLDGQAVKGDYFLTSGFAVSSVFFHPEHQKGSRFRYLGKDKDAGGAHVIAFSQSPEWADCIGSFRLEDPKTAAELYPRAPVETIAQLVRGIPLMFQGLAWVDPDTSQIVRLRTGLLAPRPEMGLTLQATEASFAAVQLGPSARRLWLPREVAVRVAWRGHLYRNFHRYSEYKLFTVESYDKTENPVIP